MKLTGEVLQRFADGKDNMKIYAPKGEKDIDQYTNEETTYPHIFTADKERYEELEKKGYVSKGKVVEEKKNKFKLEKKEEK